MAPYAWASGVSYGQYLQDNLFVRDIKGQIHKAGRGIEYQLSQQTNALIASHDALSRAFEGGFDRMNNTLDMGFDALASGLDSVTGAVETLTADFNAGMGLILEQLSAQNRALLGILDRLDAIHMVLENPTLTRAREYYRIGCDRLAKGLLDKALEAFLDSERVNDTDFFTQLRIGKLYLYGCDEDDDVLNIPEAERHLRLAVRYGKAEIGQVPELRQHVARAALHASLACFYQSAVQRNRGEDYWTQLNYSGQLAGEALKLDWNLHEAKYHIAKYSSISGQNEQALTYLTSSIRGDRNYAIKVTGDADFDSMRPLVNERLEALRKETLERAQAEVETIRSYVSDYHFLRETDKLRLREGAIAAEDMMIEHEAYFDCLDALQCALQTRGYFEGLRSLKDVFLHAEWAQMEQEQAEQQKRRERREEEERRIAAEEQIKYEVRVRRNLQAKRRRYLVEGAKMGALLGSIVGVVFGCASCIAFFVGHASGNTSFYGFVLCLGIGMVLGATIRYVHGRSKES